ncbi:MAG TPA: membrane protein insertase YidC [Stellaceae bacterium]|nr:membrane protein insertase YidC [Stellaceae bacterium]
METRRLILAIALSAAILVAFQYLAPPAKPPVRPPENAEAQATLPGAVPAPASPEASASRDDVLKRSLRVAIQTPRLAGSIALKGARIDDLTLTGYHETVDPGSPAIVLLSPSGAPHAYFAEQGWIAVTPGLKLPDDDTEWTADRATLSVGAPVTLTWENGEGLRFSREISLDANFMFTVKQTVANSGPEPVTLRPFSLISRTGVPPASQTWVSYEGAIAGLNGIEADFPYSALGTGGNLDTCKATRGWWFVPDTKGNPVNCRDAMGWVGFSDKYWLGAVAPLDQSEKIDTRLSHIGAGDSQKYQFDYTGPASVVLPGGSAASSSLVFAGAKEVKLLAQYRDAFGLLRFDNAIDFGDFWFFTKPIFYLLDLLFQAVGNFGVAILLMTVIMRILFFPLQTRAVLSMNKMKAVQPEARKLRELYGEDKVKLNQETMALYKREGVNPLGGCLPIFLQIPIFFSLYKVLYVTIEMRHAPFWGWIRDLSAPDPTTIWNLFSLVPWVPPHFLPQLGVWPIIYCGSMYLQQRMNPAPPDPVQAKMMQFMPLMFMFMLGNFASGLVIYWTWSNILVILQQYVITRHVAKPKA